MILQEFSLLINNIVIPLLAMLWKLLDLMLMIGYWILQGLICFIDKIFMKPEMAGSG